jgi:hypothetical protein
VNAYDECCPAVARQCLDWTERRHHVAGPVGVQMLTALCNHGWLKREPASRAVMVTALGEKRFKEDLGIEVQSLRGGESWNAAQVA